jgi:prepilin-type N-terminal cleavage/methylation domain-containing protein
VTVSHPRHDPGFTMIELLVTISLLGILMAIAVTGWSSWTRSSAHSGTATEIESRLRQTQQRAVTEARDMCVGFDTGRDVYTVYAGACDSGSLVRVTGPYAPSRADVRITSPSFTGRSSSSGGVTFYARGTASPGTVQVTQTGTAKVYTVHVEALTGLVSLS